MIEPGFPALDHARTYGLTGQEGTHQIHIYYLPEHLLREVLERSGYLGRSTGLRINSGIIYQYIRSSPSFFHLIQSLIQITLTGDVYLEKFQVRALILVLLKHLLYFVLAHMSAKYGYLRAAAQERLHILGPQLTHTTGNYTDFISYAKQFVFHTLSLSVICLIIGNPFCNLLFVVL